MSNEIRKYINKVMNLSNSPSKNYKGVGARNLMEGFAMNNLSVNKALVESSLKRIEHWVNSKDIAGITAFRNTLKNVTENTLIDIEVGSTYTKAQNKRRNASLKSALLKMGYGVTRVAGSYVEGEEFEVQEESFVVVNLNDAPNFKDDLFKLSEYYNQDSFLYKPINDEYAYLIGTNMSDFPGYKETINIGKFEKKINATFMSRIKGQGFAFISPDNPQKPHKPHTFGDRKLQRISRNNINEIINYLDIEKFSDLQNNSKWLCEVNSKEFFDTIKKKG